MEDTLFNARRSRRVWWFVLGVVGVVMFWYVVASIVSELNTVASMKFKKVGTAGVEIPEQGCTPTRLRSGTIESIKQSEFALRTPVLVGRGSEQLIIHLTPTTSIIEIRIPSYMNDSLKKLVNEGKDPVERVPVPVSELKTGQAVDIISLQNLCNRSEVEAARVEYKVVVNTNTSSL